MKFKMFKNLSKLIIPVLLFAPLASFAITLTTVKSTAIDPFKIITTVGNFMAEIIFGISIIVILYAAFLYVTAGGDPEATTKARAILIYGVVGIAIAALAFGFSSYVIQFFSPTQFQ